MKVLAAIALIFSTAHALALPTVPELFELGDSMGVHHSDLIQLADFSEGSDKIAALNLVKVSEQGGELLDHIRDMIAIYDLVVNDATKPAILSYIDRRLAYRVKRIDFSLKEINVQLPVIKGVALVAAADKLKADLRRLQAMIATSRPSAPPN